MRLSALIFLCLTAVLTAPVVVHAQRNAYQAEGEIRRLLDDARRAYDNLELEQSASALRRAIGLIERFGTESQDGERLAAQVYVQRGILTHVKEKNTRATVSDFTTALQYDSQIQLDSLVATPSLQRLFDQALRQVRTRRDERRGSDYGRGSSSAGGAGGYVQGGRTGGRSGGREEYNQDRGRYDDRERRDNRGGQRGSSGRDDRGNRSQAGQGDRWRNDGRQQFDRGDRGDGRRSGRGGRAADEKLTHTAPGRAKSESQLAIRLTVADYLYRDVGRVFVYFRTARARSTQKLEMLAGRGNDFQTAIPASYMRGNRLIYYFQAEDRRQNVVATLGSVRQPFEVSIDGDMLGADTYASGDSLDGGGGRGRSDRTYFSLALSLGTGFGWVKTVAKPVTNPLASLRNAGIALAPFHSLVEADFWVSHKVAIGAFARIQIVEPAYLGGARVKYLASNDGPHQVILRAGGGVGYVRHLIKLKERLDTTLEGLYHVAIGMTYAYRLSPMMSFVLTPDYLQLFGESPSYHLDVNLGLSLQF
jgi:hypothetical protein